MAIPEDIMTDFIENEDDLVLMCCDMSIGRLVDVDETDKDYYWVIEKLHNKEEHYSCLLYFVTLKDQLSDKDYSRINSIFEMNS